MLRSDPTALSNVTFNPDPSLIFFRGTETRAIFSASVEWERRKEIKGEATQLLFLIFYTQPSGVLCVFHSVFKYFINPDVSVSTEVWKPQLNKKLIFIISLKSYHL